MTWLMVVIGLWGVVPKHAWAEGGYEPGVSWLDDSADERFRAAAAALLKGLDE